jgi:limonene-1,2-epoxide hydrolase
MTQTSDLEFAARTFYLELDDNDPEIFQRRLTANASFTFNAIDPITGVDAIGTFVSDWKANFDALLHDVDKMTIDATTNTVAVELAARYIFHDSRQVDLKGCAFLEFGDDAIVSWRVYVDTSRLGIPAADAI